MLQLVIASLGFIPWVFYIIYTYYSKNFSAIDHIETASGYGGYLAAVWFIYLVYKITSLMIHTNKVRFSFWYIFWFSLINLLIITIWYTEFQVTTGSPFFGPGWASSFVLFWHVLSLLIYPLFLAFLWRAIWYSILKFIKWWNDIALRIRIGAEISIWLAVFSSWLIIIGALHIFTLTWLLILCTILAIIAIPGWIMTYRDIKNKYIEFDQHETNSDTLVGFINPRLITVEFAFMIVSFLISVSLINAIRPMPIGWDDLWIYMNFPRIISITWASLEWAGMFTWQLITASGFLWDQIAANAFYVNQLWWILSVIIITSVLSVIFDRKDHKYLISLPLLLASIYYMMPMTIFQQAKDMKLDPALMMVSVSAFGILWYSIRWNLEKNKFYYLIALAGIIVGVAFSIKFTTLILIIACLSLISYHILGLWGLIWFFFLFLWIFTWGNLWAKMNVWLPIDNIELINTSAITCGLIGIFAIAFALWNRGIHHGKVWLITNIVFLIGLSIALTPWFIKNGYEAWTFTQNQKWSIIDWLLSGYGTIGFNNYSAIYSKEEYSAKRKAQQSASITSDGKSQNEDFSRYFGQESGLNNYLKLPANLTFQKNQSGEFTDITYIFLAFFPAILLFVRWKKYGNKKWTQYIFLIFVAAGMLLMIHYYFNKSTWLLFSWLLGTIWLPLWYAFIIGWILFLISLIHLLVNNDEDGIRIKEIFIVLMVYGFLFLISAFGIVWYGVFVYFLFLTIIWLGALAFISYKDDEEDTQLGVKVTISFLFFIFIIVYIFRSALPHGWNNLTTAGMNEYKYKKLTQNESIFTYRNDYITAIATMNVLDPALIVKRAWLLAKSATLKSILTPERLSSMWPADLHQIIIYFITQIEAGKIKQDKQIIVNDIANIGHELYTSILSPKWTDVNLKWIYRIGTFMTYLINQNQKRYIDDSLIFEFETFFYDPSPEKTIDRMKKVWLSYLLTDLNAATIDRDPRRALTTRFEHLLLTMRAKNLRLVDTDSLCLRVALDEYKAWRLQTDTEFIDIAWINYESYRGADMKPVFRAEKQIKCQKYIINMMNSPQTGVTLPDYLNKMKTNLMNTKSKEEQEALFVQSFGQSYFAFFEIIDAPPPIQLANPSIITISWSTNSWNTTEKSN